MLQLQQAGPVLAHGGRPVNMHRRTPWLRRTRRAGGGSFQAGARGGPWQAVQLVTVSLRTGAGIIGKSCGHTRGSGSKLGQHSDDPRLHRRHPGSGSLTPPAATTRASVWWNRARGMQQLPGRKHSHKAAFPTVIALSLETAFSGKACSSWFPAHTAHQVNDA